MGKVYVGKTQLGIYMRCLNFVKVIEKVLLILALSDVFAAVLAQFSAPLVRKESCPVNWASCCDLGF